MKNKKRSEFAMMVQTIAVSAILLTQVTPAFAESDSVNSSVQTKISDENPSGGSKIESWYTYWGLGYSRPSYSGDLGNVLSNAKTYGGANQFGINLDLLGFYLPVNHHQTAVGVIVNAVGDRFSMSSGPASASIQLNQYSLSFSTMHFLTSNIGDGFFVRGDLGPTWYLASVEARVGSISGDRSFGSSMGVGGLLGVGYAFPVSRSGGTRLLVNANYSYRYSSYNSFYVQSSSGELAPQKGTGVSTLSLSGGVMF